ncbi:MAG: DUF6901 family protein [Thermodesulfobacteriota bacterium]
MTSLKKRPAGKTSDKAPLVFEYRFNFEDGSSKYIPIHLEADSLRYIPQREVTPDPWTRLEFHRCSNCSFDAENVPHCPIALSIKELISEFRERVSYEKAQVYVETRERTYYENTTMQRGLSSILGILMVSSGCPVMDKLRPMVRFHLPFPSIMETTFRTTSAYLLGQFFLMKRGRTADFTFHGLAEIYRNVKLVNRAMASRIRALSMKDASVNALILLDLFAVDVPMSIEDQIADLEPFFHTYFND